MPGGNGTAYLIKTEFIINALQEKVTAVEAVLFIHGEICSGAEFNIEFGAVFQFRFVHQANLFLSPCFGICNTISFADVFFRAQPFYDQRLILAIHVNSFLYIIRNGILRFGPSQPHSITSIDVYNHYNTT